MRGPGPVRGKSTVPYFCCRIRYYIGPASSSSSNCSRQIRVSNYKRILLLLSNGWHWHSGALGPQTCFLFSVQDKWNLIKLGPFFLFLSNPSGCWPVQAQIETNDGADCLVELECRDVLFDVCVSFFFLSSSRNKRRKKTGHQCHSANRPL